MPAPIPPAAPVTIATLPSSSLILFLQFVQGRLGRDLPEAERLGKVRSISGVELRDRAAQLAGGEQTRDRGALDAEHSRGCIASRPTGGVRPTGIERHAVEGGLVERHHRVRGTPEGILTGGTGGVVGEDRLGGRLGVQHTRRGGGPGARGPLGYPALVDLAAVVLAPVIEPHPDPP